jgi:5-methylcytosine-specific restriction endonuclease McrA
MNDGDFWQLGAVSDAELQTRLSQLLVSGYRTEARIVAHLAEVEEFCGASRIVREHILNAIRREVVARDGFRCTFVGEDGCRCTASSFLQIHHEQPWANGGESSVGNLRLLCVAHNRLLAERDFGSGSD